MKYQDMQYEWTTFQGKKVTLETIDHQHLSNVYWYARIFFESIPGNVLKIISERFNGQVLEYRPHADFEQEIQALENKGMLVWYDRLSGGKEGIISRNGEVIGRVFNGKL